MSPAVSVVMPMYNAKLEYLQKSIESVLNQMFEDFVLLIIDDGSTETEGVDLINSYQDSRICLIKNPHNFIDSLNKGVAESKGKYIARMDADDIMIPDRLQIQYDFMEQHPEIDVCGSWIEVFGDSSQVIQTSKDHEQIVTSLLLHNTMAHPSVMWRKSTVGKKNVPLYRQEYNCAEDYKLWTDLAVEGLRFANIPQVLLRYRSSDNQTTKVKREAVNLLSTQIRLEYAKQVIKQLIKKDKVCAPFLDELMKLYEHKVILPDTFLKIIYNFYHEQLSK